jgi:type I restriction enzyme S subunit
MKNRLLNDFTKVFTVIPSSQTKVKSSSYLESGKYAVVDQGKDLVAGYTNTAPTVNEESLPVVVFGDHTRAVKYVDFPFAAGADGTQILKPSPLAIPKYCFYLVLHAVSQIPSKGYARHFGELKKMLFPLPSIEKQFEIVEKLDSAFAEIDLFEVNLNLQENYCDELMYSIQQDLFLRKLKLVRIGDVCKLATGGTPSRTRPEYFINGTVKWLVSGDIHQREIYDCDARITEEAMKSSNTKILPLNSVMIALNGQGKTRGTVALLRTEATCNQSLVSISPVDESELLSEFLFYNLKMRYQELRRMTGDDGNDRRGLNMNLIRNIEIPLLPIENQREIVEKIDSAFKEIELLRSQLKIEKDNAMALRQSLLSSAFTQEESVA